MKLPHACTFSENDWNILANYWHPVAYSYDVQDKPVPVVLLDEKIVIYRTPQGITAAKNICPHRGTLLSNGWIDNDRLVCPYHGLAYNEKGKCVQIPAAGKDAKIPENLCLQTFKIEEKHGLVWVCLKEPQLPLPKNWEVMDKKGLQKIRLGPSEWDANSTRYVENFNDVAHFSWVHHGTFGDRDAPEIDRYTVEETEVGLKRVMQVRQLDQSAFEGADTAETVNFDFTYELTLPYASSIHIKSETKNEWIFSYASPVSANKIKIFMLMARDFDTDELTEDWSDFQYAIAAQDRPIVESQFPEHSPLDLADEFHIEADAWSIAYRRKLKELGLQGQ